MTTPAALTGVQRARAEGLFADALARDAPERDAWVAHVAADDPTVVREVLSLLRDHARAGRFLTEPLGAQAVSVLEGAGPDVLDALGEAGWPSGRLEAAAESRGPLAPGAVVGPYTIEREIGRGGMGCVYLARDTRLGRSVALKALAPRLSGRPAERDRLRREAAAAAALVHPGICTVFAFEEIDGRPFIATEFVEGRTLRQEMTSMVRPSGAEVLAVSRDLAAALAAAHARGIVHRDLKPENVMRGVDGRVKVLDFGLASRDEHDPSSPLTFETVPGGLVGTPAYMAPEQLQGERASMSSDVFAFGVLLYEYASGRHPFHAETPGGMAGRLLETSPEPLGSVRPDLPAPFARIIDRCLARQPGARYGSARELADALQIEGASEHAPPSTALPSPSPRVQAEPPREPSPERVPLTVWWRRHQGAVIGLYGLSAAAGWAAKEWAGGGTIWVFFALAAAGMVGGVIRGHLIFSDRANHALFEAERRRARPLTAVTDALVGAAVTLDGVAVASTRPVPAALLFGLGLGVGLARFVIEPSTEAGAFGVEP